MCIFSSKNYKVLGLTFMFHYFEVILYVVLKNVFKSFFACGYLVVPVPFVEQIISYTELSLNLTKNQLTIDANISGISNLFLLIYIPTLMLVPYHLKFTIHFVVSFEIRKCESFQFVLYQNYSGCSGFHAFSHTF